ncbi:ribosomal protein [Lithospermum erythrorhizon]|uniref:Large ribosomal subunit protein bL32m n=1 Tax=Lithospermum erythrorhizon TaxID=34254 RepID=A0AAV3RK64_LITER
MALNRKVGGAALGLRRCIHAIAQQPPLSNIMSPSTNSSPPIVLPEDDSTINDNNFGFEFSDNLFIGGSLELMAVPKKKTSRHKRGIRNGPKFLKPAPVIIRCKVCGQVKLPHFFCCSGIKEDTGGQG